MDLALSEIQQMLKTSAREVLAREFPFEVVRAMEGDAKGYTPELWQSMTELGWLGLVVPEKYGGAEGSFLDLGMLLEEMGRALTPGPFFSTVVLGALTVINAGNESMQSKLLPGIASGDTIMTMAVTEESGGYGPDGIHLQAEHRDGEFVLSGRKLFVPDAHVADYAIVAARTSKRLDPKKRDNAVSHAAWGRGHHRRASHHDGVGEAGTGGFQRRSGVRPIPSSELWIKVGLSWSERSNERQRQRGWRWWGAPRRCWR